MKSKASKKPDRAERLMQRSSVYKKKANAASNKSSAESTGNAPAVHTTKASEPPAKVVASLPVEAAHAEASSASVAQASKDDAFAKNKETETSGVEKNEAKSESSASQILKEVSEVKSEEAAAEKMEAQSSTTNDDNAESTTEVKSKDMESTSAPLSYDVVGNTHSLDQLVSDELLDAVADDLVEFMIGGIEGLPENISVEEALARVAEMEAQEKAEESTAPLVSETAAQLGDIEEEYEVISASDLEDMNEEDATFTLASAETKKDEAVEKQEETVSAVVNDSDVVVASEDAGQNKSEVSGETPVTTVDTQEETTAQTPMVPIAESVVASAPAVEEVVEEEKPTKSKLAWYIGGGIAVGAIAVGAILLSKGHLRRVQK